MKAEISIDFLTFTVKGGFTPQFVISDILEMDISLFEETKGHNFYSSSLVFNNIRVNYNGYYEKQMGVSVNMSGSGCRAYEEYHGRDILGLLARIHKSEHMHGTRIDVACDDKVGFLNMDDMWECAHNGSFRSKLRSKRFYESYKGSCVGARSIYFGSNSSLFLVRIYDKAKHTYHPEHDAELYYSHWLRFECVFKDIYADQVIKALVETDNVGGTVAGLINDRFTFINHDDSNISRCTPCSWWLNFLESMERVSLSTKAKVEHSIELKSSYVEHSYGRTLAIIASAMGEERILDIIEYGKSKFTKADKSQIADYKEKKYIDFWEPVFGRVSRYPKKRLGERYKPLRYSGDSREIDSLGMLPPLYVPVVDVEPTPEQLRM